MFFSIPLARLPHPHPKKAIRMPEDGQISYAFVAYGVKKVIQYLEGFGK
jgi:hypothetical protein